MMKHMALLASASLLCACDPAYDMQGRNPQEYYAAHPPVNKVETRNETHTLHFPSGAPRLSGEAIDALRSGLNDVSPTAVESVQVQFHPSQMSNQKRREHLAKLLRAMGYDRNAILFEPSGLLARDEARIDVSYAAVDAPHCPDWRTSPVTTYSNTMQGNFGCATTVNHGLMVADPRELERGSGEWLFETDRAAQVVRDYRGGKDFGANSASTSASGGDSAASPTEAATPAQ